MDAEFQLGKNKMVWRRTAVNVFNVPLIMVRMSILP